MKLKMAVATFVVIFVAFLLMVLPSLLVAQERLMTIGSLQAAYQEQLAEIDAQIHAATTTSADIISKVKKDSKCLKNGICEDVYPSHYYELQGQIGQLESDRHTIELSYKLLDAAFR